MADEIPSEIQALLYDPQTSGGLLIALIEGEADTCSDGIPRHT